jgi:hypothetical protein
VWEAEREEEAEGVGAGGGGGGVIKSAERVREGGEEASAERKWRCSMLGDDSRTAVMAARRVMAARSETRDPAEASATDGRDTHGDRVIVRVSVRRISRRPKRSGPIIAISVSNLPGLNNNNNNNTTTNNSKFNGF